jgi:DNA polymerase-3 subunit gamma/tau
MARILTAKLECSSHDYYEKNSADFRGIDTVRDMRKLLYLSRRGGKNRVFVLDEVHKMTNDAQTALLKMLEDTPPHVYFMLCTTEPTKVISAIHSRCTEIKLSPVADSVLGKLVRTIAAKVGCKHTDKVYDRIVEVAEGSARKALVLLQATLDFEDEEECLNSIRSTQAKQDAIEIARALIRGAYWKDLAKILKEVDEEPETIRHLVLAYATTVLLNGGGAAPRAFFVVNAFRDNFFDSKKAGLVAACWEVCGRK